MAFAKCFLEIYFCHQPRDIDFNDIILSVYVILQEIHNNLFMNAEYIWMWTEEYMKVFFG